MRGTCYRVDFPKRLSRAIDLQLAQSLREKEAKAKQ